MYVHLEMVITITWNHVINYNQYRLQLFQPWLNGAPSTRVGQSRSQGMLEDSSTNDQMQRKPKGDKQVWRGGEISNGDGKKLCYLVTNMFRE